MSWRSLLSPGLLFRHAPPPPPIQPALGSLLPLQKATACFYSTHTIYALSTSPGKAGVAVIRVSGPNAKLAIDRMAAIKDLKARQAYFRRIRHPVTRDVLDRGLVLWFPGPHSFTGEDTVELHVHGGNAVVKSMLDALKTLDSFRMAEPGEFARRAFDNDKLDLTELEGLADLLNAETEAQRQLALRQAEGGLRVLYDGWRSQIIQSMALTEAVIDFGEDENIEDGVLEQATANIENLRDSVSRHLNDCHVGEIVRNGIRVVIAGPPNAGKSTLLNQLAKREAAIVSDIPGTTRDVLEVNLDLGGYPVIMSDTAGLRESNDPIEMEGVKRAISRLQDAHIKICLVPLTSTLAGFNISPAVRRVIDQNTFVILTKLDLIAEDVDQLADTVARETGARKVWAISCKTGQGLNIFIDGMIDTLKKAYDESLAAASPALITQARHRQHLQDCLESLDRYLELPVDEVVLKAEELRQAANALGRITGRVDVEDVLDALFGQFCIGK